MRSTAFAVAVLLVGLSGCIADEAPDPPLVEEAVDEAPPARSLPGAIDATEEVLVGNYLTCPWAEIGCYRYPFTLEVDAIVDTRLSWTNELNDFDLYLYRDTELLGADDALPPQSTAVLRNALTPGYYVIEVVPYVVVADTFQLSITFE